jgi:hypothetical protein
LTPAIKTTAIFLRPFELADFNETLPSGEYEIEIVRPDRADGITPASRAPRVRVRLHSLASHPGLSRTLTVSLAAFDLAAAKDKLSGKALTDFVLEEMLADPMIRLFMRADGVSEAEVRGLYSGRVHKRAGGDQARLGTDPVPAAMRYDAMSPRQGSSRPGIGE